MNALDKYKLRLKAQLLRWGARHIPGDWLLQRSQIKALKSFQRAATLFPAYRRLLDEQGVVKSSVRTPKDFQGQVPVISKTDVFGRFKPNELVAKSCYRQVKSILVSSGTSGNFSLGLKSKKELVQAAHSADVALESYYQVSEKKTLLINCLPMGARMYSFLDAAEVGAHARRAIALLETALCLDYEQIFIMCLGHIFMKQLIELGAECGVDWRRQPVYFFSGGEALPENARRYLESYLGSATDDKGLPRLACAGGVTELQLNSLFFETPETISIRKAAHQDEALRKELFQTNSKACPMFFAWNPLASYVEIVGPQDGYGHILVTNLDRNALVPLVRYNIGDIGLIISPERIKRSYQNQQLGPCPLPGNLPLIAIAGRGQGRAWSLDAVMVAKEIQEAMYHDATLAGVLTANWRVTVDESGKRKVLAQLKPGMVPADELTQKLHDIICRYTNSEMAVSLIQYGAFPYNMSLDFENKFSYMDMI